MNIGINGSVHISAHSGNSLKLVFLKHNIYEHDFFKGIKIKCIGHAQKGITGTFRLSPFVSSALPMKPANETHPGLNVTHPGTYITHNSASDSVLRTRPGARVGHQGSRIWLFDSLLSKLSISECHCRFFQLVETSQRTQFAPATAVTYPGICLTHPLLWGWGEREQHPSHLGWLYPTRHHPMLADWRAGKGNCFPVRVNSFEP